MIYSLDPIGRFLSFNQSTNSAGGSSCNRPEEAGQNAPPVDLTETMEALGDDFELFQELVEIFFEQYPLQVETLRKHLHNKASLPFGEAAHSLKGSVGNFRAQRAWDIAYQLERKGKGGDLSGAESLLSELEQELDRVRDFLKKALQNTGE